MNRIFLCDTEKRTLLAFNSRKNARENLIKIIGKEDAIKAIDSLVNKGLLIGKCPTDQEGYLIVEISDFGREYLNYNPKLKNPLSEKHTERKKFWTGIKGQVITHCFTLLIGYSLGYITKEYANNKHQNMTKPVVEIQSLDSLRIIDTIIINDKKVFNSFK